MQLVEQLRLASLEFSVVILASFQDLVMLTLSILIVKLRLLNFLNLHFPKVIELAVFDFSYFHAVLLFVHNVLIFELVFELSEHLALQIRLLPICPSDIHHRFSSHFVKFFTVFPFD